MQHVIFHGIFFIQHVINLLRKSINRSGSARGCCFCADADKTNNLLLRESRKSDSRGKKEAAAAVQTLY